MLSEICSEKQIQKQQKKISHRILPLSMLCSIHKKVVLETIMPKTTTFILGETTFINHSNTRLIPNRIKQGHNRMPHHLQIETQGIMYCINLYEILVKTQRNFS